MAAPSTYNRLQDRLEELSATLQDLILVASDLSEEHVRNTLVKVAIWDAMTAIDKVRLKVFLHQKQDRRARSD